MIPGLSTIKTYLLAGLAVLSGVLAALWQYQRAAFKSAALKGVKKARKTERKAVENMVEGLKNEQKAESDAKNNTSRTDFE